MSVTTISFDTLKFVTRLENSGLPRAQATAILEAQKDSLAKVLETTLVTKTDIGKLENELHVTNRELVRIDGKMEKLAWMVGILVVLAVANFAKQFF